MAYFGGGSFAPLHQQILLSIKDCPRICGNKTNPYFKDSGWWMTEFYLQKSSYFLVRSMVFTSVLCRPGVQSPWTGLIYAPETESSHFVHSLPLGGFRATSGPYVFVWGKNLLVCGIHFRKSDPHSVWPLFRKIATFWKWVIHPNLFNVSSNSVAVRNSKSHTVMYNKSF